ncbi:TetR/AcrR family transcriptional regulator [Subtercola sp. YIM 133946]|uniref:TetR/AcrR family transcriptional regulator n=1 Tax=Subtercola sp. YIM 133946 TaxID=3118909 RepID=UPI002F95B263
MGERKNERQRLLSLVGDLILDEGVSGQSLSSLARKIGSNNRMVLYYFGSKEDLLAEASLEAFIRFPLLRQMTTRLTSDPGTLEQRLDAAWLQISDPANIPYLRLFFEAFGVASHSPEKNQSLLTTMGTDWVQALVGVLRADGFDEPTARLVTVQILALWRGLQFDLLRGTPRDTLDAAHPVAIRGLLTANRALTAL